MAFTKTMQTGLLKQLAEMQITLGLLEFCYISYLVADS